VQGLEKGHCEKRCEISQETAVKQQLLAKILLTTV